MNTLSMENKYNITVNGVNPEEGFQEFLEKAIDGLMDWAPSDSATSSYVTKIKNGYSGIVNIVSSQGRFVAKAVSEDLNEIVSTLKKQIREQIDAWRERRSFNDMRMA